MEIAPAGVPLTFEVTFSSTGLPVAMSVYDTTGEAPVKVAGPTAMGSVVGNTYYGQFTAGNNKSYVIFKAVYTDETFATLDTSYSQSSESIVVDDQGGSSGGGSGCQLVGYVLENLVLTGIVEC